MGREKLELEGPVQSVPGTTSLSFKAVFWSKVGALGHYPGETGAPPALSSAISGP